VAPGTTDPGSARRSDKGVGDNIADVWEVIRAYARQETVDPLRNVGRFLGYGIAGSLLVGLGVFFLGLAGLRALQDETTVFDGAWSFAPYLIVAVAMVVVTGLAVMAATRNPERDVP
jgi:hypothetical protein